jgi:hypothetical protein
VDCGIATGDGVGYGTRHLIQRNIVDAESPNKVVNILDVLLMGLWSKQRLKHPSAAVNLPDVAQLLERRDTFSHNWNLPRAVIYIFHTNRPCRTSVDGTFVVFDRDELALIVEDRPVFLEQLIHEVPGRAVKVGQIDLRPQLLSVNLFVVRREEARINVVERGRGMFAPPKNWAALNVMQDHIKVVRLVGKPPIVEKYVGTLLAPNLPGDSDWLAGWIG